MRVIVLGLLLVNAVQANYQPNIELTDGVKIDRVIGKYVELKEGATVFFKCFGSELLEFQYPRLEDNAGYDKKDFEDRVDQTTDDFNFEETLTLKKVRQSDTGTYHCVDVANPSLNDSIHIFVYGQNQFLPTKSLLYVYEDGDVHIPCRATKNINSSHVDLFVDNMRLETEPEDYDPRIGFKLTRQAYDFRPVINVAFQCRSKIYPNQKVEYLITENDPKPSNDDYQFYWEKTMDWPYIGYNYSITCHLKYSGSAGNFHPFYNQLTAECPQCSSSAGSRAFADRNRLNKTEISATVRIASLEHDDSGTYKCTWKQEGKRDRVIEEIIEVAPKRAQIRIEERSVEVVRLKEGEPFRLNATFSMFPSNDFTAKWSRLYNSSLRNVQTEAIVNDDHRIVTANEIRDGTFLASLRVDGAASTVDKSGTYILAITLKDTVQVVKWEVAIENPHPYMQLTILEPSSFILFNQAFYPPGTHLHIACVSVSIPPARVVLLQRPHKAVGFQPIDRKTLMAIDGTFDSGLIYNITLDDDIELECAGVAHDGHVTNVKKAIHVSDSEPLATSKIIKSDKATRTEDKKSVFEGDDVELLCVVPTGAADWRGFWRFDNIIMDSETTVEGHSKRVVLYLRNVTSSSSGSYYCVLQSGDSEKTLEKHVTVEKAVKPHHTTADSRKSLSIDYDRPFELDCNMIGTPLPVYSWFKDGKPYVHGESEGSVLKVSRARAEDGGQFHCSAANRAGATSNFLEVTVQGAPKTTSYLEISIVFGFICVVLLCAVGYYAWSKRRDKRQFKIDLANMHARFMATGEEKASTDIVKDIPIHERIDHLPYNPKFDIKPGNLDTGVEIGCGQFGKVFKGKLRMADPRSTKEQGEVLEVAVKTARNEHDVSQIEMLMEEIRFMCALGKHPNVLTLVGASTDDMKIGNGLRLVVEYINGGDLCKFLRTAEKEKRFFNELIEVKGGVEAADESYLIPNSAQKKKTYKLFEQWKTDMQNNENEEAVPFISEFLAYVTTSDLVSIAMQIANGMDYLSRIPCVHRDLACRNILITKNNVIRVADFGLAKHHPQEDYYKSSDSKEFPIPIRWMPLEAIDDKIFTHKSDVWAFGICLYEIFTLGKTPYPGYANHQIFEHLREGGRNSQPKYSHDDLYKLMVDCWEEHPKDRPTFAQCVKALKDHMNFISSELLGTVEAALNEEEQKQMKLDDWVNPCRQLVTFKEPVQEERYCIVETSA